MKQMIAEHLKKKNSIVQVKKCFEMFSSFLVFHTDSEGFDSLAGEPSIRTTYK